MYKLNYFKEEDREKIIEFIKGNPFAIICSDYDKYPAATQVPLQMKEKDGKIYLTGHVMKNTDHHKAFRESKHVLIIFNGPHSYISASWYINPKVASTWNYMTVHAKGVIEFTDEHETINIIRELTDEYEGKDKPGSFNELPEEYVNRLVKAIVGFHISVDEVEAVFKLSQNHEIENRQMIITKLLEKGDDNSISVAKEMQIRITQPKLSK